MDIIKNRRSRRNFTSKKVSIDDIKKIVEAGTYAPTGMNKQDNIIVAISDDSTMDNLLNAIRKHLNNDNYNGFYNCKNMILLLSPSDNRNRKFDCGCIMQNMMLKACELNVANVWINQFYDSYNSEPIREFLKSLDIDNKYEITCALALGYSDENPKTKPNKFITKLKKKDRLNLTYNQFQSIFYFRSYRSKFYRQLLQLRSMLLSKILSFLANRTSKLSYSFQFLCNIS